MAKNSTVIAWLQLLRLPNVFTAVADVAMGYLVSRGNLTPIWHFGMLVFASCLLYLSGMVLNDVFDADVDASDRPDRPIPSGRVTKRAAATLGWTMLIAGALTAWALSFAVGDWRPGRIATSLAICILIYDGALKRTPLAPLFMGACRFLNVLLGMSLANIQILSAIGAPGTPRPWHAHEWLIALGVGIYIVGVTIFARTEARESSRPRLIGGLVILLFGIAVVAATPLVIADEQCLRVSDLGWYLLWAALALITARRCAIAVANPAPRNVQLAVRHCVQSIIVLDAAICVGYAGPFWGFAVLSLLVPTFLLTVWLDAT